VLFRLHADLRPRSACAEVVVRPALTATRVAHRARTSVHENSTQPRPQVETMRRLLDSIDRGY
jgi:hypothetical protein